MRGFLAPWRKRRSETTPGKGPDTRSDKGIDRGLLVFENTSEVIRAEKVLKDGGWRIRVMGPPPEIQRGCDLVIEFPLMEKLHILRALGEADTPPLEAVPVTGPLLKPVDLYHIKDFGTHIMIRAANMKLTVDTATLEIVNISGGGCPDVPYLASEMIGKRLGRPPRPSDLGHTLCAYALDLAYEEALRRCLPS